MNPMLRMQDGLYPINGSYSHSRYPSSAPMHDGLHTLESRRSSTPHWSCFPARSPTGTFGTVAPGEVRKDTIGGLRPSTFWVLVLMLIVVAVAASVGGAIGVIRASPNDACSTMNSPSPNASNTTSFSTTTVPSVSPANPTYVQGRCVSSCPGDNNTVYTPTNPENGRPFATQYQKISGNWRDTSKHYLVSATVPNFDSCIQLCAEINNIQTSHADDIACKVVNFARGSFPLDNCWVSNISTSLNESGNWDTAILVESD